MRWYRILRLRLLSLLRRAKADSDLQNELEDHLRREIEENIRGGMSPDDSRYAAKRSIGPLALYEEECREARGTALFDNFVRDMRYANRVLRRTPLFAVVAVTTLGLGLGANTTIFTLINKLLLRPLPVRDPEQLVSLNTGGGVTFSYPNYKDIRDRNNVFSELAAVRFNPVDLSIGGERNFRVWGYEVTGNYFDLLEVRPYLGRFFERNDDAQPGANPVLVLGYGCWQSRFAADPKVIGRRVKINGFDFTVIGVAQPSFTGTELIIKPDFWVPTSMERQVEPGNNWLESRFAGVVWLLGRLKPGITRVQAQASLERVAHQLAHDYPAADRDMTITLSSPGLIGNVFRGPVTNFAAVVMAVAGLVLLLACVNLAGLLLARAADRRKEIAVRLSIGAGRAQLVRQMLTESLLLALGGAFAGWLIAFGLTYALKVWHPPVDLPINTSFDPDFRVLFFTCLAALLTTFLCGLAPALQATKVDLIPALKNDAPNERRFRLTMRDFLVVAQVALSLILLITSVLVLRSLQNALHLKLGFNPENAVSVSFDLGLQGYTEARGREFQKNVLAHAARLPGIEAAGSINYMPLRIGESSISVSIPGRSKARSSGPDGANLYSISPGYLRAAGTRLLAGRDIDEHDGAGSTRVALVNEAFARRLLPGENPVGKRFRLGPIEQSPLVEIAGVVENGKYEFLGEDPALAVFVPVSQDYNGWTTLVARTSLPAAEAIRELRSAISRLDPEIPLFNAGSLKEELAWPLLPSRIAAAILGAFGAVAILLAGIGLFAVVASSVARRSHEIGIRMALGARAGQVLGFLLRRTMLLCLSGVFAGTAITLGTARLLSAIVYGISPRDPLTYALALLLMTALAVLACWHPARRAIRIDPARTLRAE